MSSREQARRFKALNRWFYSPEGRGIAEVFQEALLPVKTRLQGATLAQLGACGDNIWLPGLRFRHRWVISPGSDGTNAEITSLLHQLPLENHSIDCVLAPLTAEGFSSCVALLDEIDRVLVPEGHAIFLGINPASLWGAWLKWSSYNPFGALHGHPHSSLWLKMALRRSGYTTHSLHTFYYIPPFTKPAWVQRLRVLNQIGKMVSPLPPAFYCLVMQKKAQSWIERIQPAMYFSPRTVYTSSLLPQPRINDVIHPRPD